MNTMQDRLALFLSELNISMQKFERQCDMGQGAASKLSAKSYATTFAKISRAYPQLNVDWLKTGEGQMLKPVQSVGDISNSNVAGVNVSGTEIHISNPEAYNALLETVKTYQRITEKYQAQLDKAQQQIDELIALLKAKI